MARHGAASVISLLFLLHAVASAAPIVIGNFTNSTWSDPQLPSPVLRLGMQDADVPPALVGSWALHLRITSLPGATGTVNFDVASIPSDYLFVGRGLPTGPIVAISPDELSAMDIDLGGLFNLPPVAVPLAAGSLLDLSFVASQDARGLFAIEALPFRSPDAGSYWTATGDFAGHAFANESADGAVLDTILLGQQVSVPEPRGTHVWLLILLTLTVSLYSSLRNQV